MGLPIRENDLLDAVPVTDALGAIAPPPQRRIRRLLVEDSDQMVVSAERWLVDGFWPETGLVFVCGPSMSGKTFWLADTCYRASLGLPVLGQTTKKSGVLYCAAEGGAGFRKRVAALRQAYGEAKGAFQVVAEPLNLADADGVESLRLAVAEARKALAHEGQALCILAIDTLSASIPGVDENTSADLGRVLHLLQEMAYQERFLLVLVAHTGKDESRGIRGWSGQLANADGALMLSAPKGGVHTGTVTKVKDGASGKTFAFKLKAIDLESAAGHPVGSCVVEYCDPPKPATRRPGTQKAQNAEIIWAAFQRVRDPEKDAATQAQLREAAYEAGLCPASDEEGASPDGVKRWHDRRKKAFRRGLDELVATGQVQTSDDGDYVMSAS